MIKIFLVEDHHVVRNGLKMLLNNEPDLEVVAEAENGLEILKLLDQGVKADILISDMSMPEMDGMQLLQQIWEKGHAVKVIFLSMLDAPKMVYSAIQAGASAYLFKNSEAIELIFAIKYVHSGGRYLSTDLQFNMLAQQAHGESISLENTLIEPMTERELEVLRLIAEGFTNSEMADKLFLSKRTVEGHRQLLLNKTQAKNSAHMVKIATEMRLL